MGKIILEIPSEVYKAMWLHLLPKRFISEEAAFMFAQRFAENNKETFRCLEWYPILPQGFLTRTRFHLELTDEARAAAIKKAHDIGASLIEIHSHYGPWPAQFSASDFLGFREFVPHVWWRLKGRPYLAIVASKSSFDGLAWISNPKAANHLDGIVVGRRKFIPTKLSSIGDNLHDI